LGLALDFGQQTAKLHLPLLGELSEGLHDLDAADQWQFGRFNGVSS